MRIVDVGAAMSGLPVGEARLLPGPGELPAGRGNDVDGDDNGSNGSAVTLRVLDPQAPWNDGIWSFSASGGLLAAKKLSTAEQAPTTAHTPTVSQAPTTEQAPGMPALTIGELTAWAFGCASGNDLLQSGADLSEDTARAMDALLPKKPFFIYEMY